MSAFIKQIRKIAANLKKSISLCSWFPQISCNYWEMSNFDDATEAVIFTLNFNPTSADSHRQTMHSIALKTQAIV